MGRASPSGTAPGPAGLLAPVVIAPVGRTALQIAPKPLSLPLDFGRVRDQLEGAIGEIVSGTRWVDSLAEAAVDDDYNWEPG